MPATAPAAPPTTGGMAPEAQKYVDALITLYTTRDTKAQDDVVSTHYAEKATFTDNLVAVHGHPSIKVQFHAIAKMLKYAKFEPLTSSLERVSEAKQVVKIGCKQEFGLGSSVFKFDVAVTLDLDSAGKITRHEDVWQDKWNPYGIFKRLLGSMSSTMMKVARV